MFSGDGLSHVVPASVERTDLSSKGIVAPLFDDAASEYRRAGLRTHSAGTKKTRKGQLRRISDYFGPLTLDQIDADQVVNFYNHLRESLSERTSDRYLDAISVVYQWHEQPSPVPEARGRIAKKRPRTASARALNDANCNPVAAKTMALLLPRLSGDLLTTTLLCYEAGLRIGEAVGLKWDDVTFGTDDDDTRRSVLVKRSRVGQRVGRTKTGHKRRVRLSRRLRRHLLARFMEAGRPTSGWIITQSTHHRIHDRMGRAATAAKVDRPLFKDFRDTYASTLITHGIVLKWISLELGHASVAVTEKHYAAYMAVDGYQNPWIVPDGCLPSDLFAELDGWHLGGVTKASLSVTKAHK